MKKKKLQKKRRRNKNKHSKFFKMLMKSVNEAVAIHKGEIEPARITTLRM
jgi:malonyl CoA-acyl carrier protein transacylase